MAAATVTKTEWGYYVTGGTSATTIDAGKIWVKCIAFAGNTDNATATLTSLPDLTGATTVSCMQFKTNGNDLDAAGNKLFFGDKGCPFNGLAVTLSNTGDFLYVYLKF